MGRARVALPGGLALLLLLGCSVDDTALRLAVSTEEPAPAIAAALSTAMATRNLSIDVQTVSDPSVAIEKIRRLELDLAIIEEPDRPLHGLLTLAPLYPSVLHVLHNRSEPPSGIADLIRGAAIYAGPPGGAAQRLLIQLAVDFNIDGSEYQLLENPWTQTPDVYFIFGGLLTEESVAQLTGYRLFSFADADDAPGGSVADGIALKHHHLSPFLLPKGVYHTLAEGAVLTLSIRSILIAQQGLDEDLAYDIAETLFGQSQEIALHYPLVTRELNENAQVTELMLPLHEGTRRYLDRDRPGFVERNVDVLALYFTILVTFVSIVVALYRHRSQRRKDRVDVYYQRLLDIRDKMEQTATGSRIDDCYDEVLTVQREVFVLLIDERIAADSSLVAFVGLSGQILNDLYLRSDNAGNKSQV